MSDPTDAPAKPARKPFEQWAAEKKTPRWVLAAVRGGERWPAGYEVTEAKFDAAAKRAAEGASR